MSYAYSTLRAEPVRDPEDEETSEGTTRRPILKLWTLALARWRKGSGNGGDNFLWLILLLALVVLVVIGAWLLWPPQVG